jgi:ketosteroid isomerase-like protein
VQALRETYGAAWADHDADRIAELHTEDTRFQTHIGTPPVVGRDAMRAACAQIFEQYQNFRPEPRSALYGDKHWVLQWTLHATSAGKDFSVDCVDVVVLADDGLVASKDTYMDAAQLQAALS